jgi:hypothetical protein
MRSTLICFFVLLVLALLVDSTEARGRRRKVIHHQPKESSTDTLDTQKVFHTSHTPPGKGLSAKQHALSTSHPSKGPSVPTVNSVLTQPQVLQTVQKSVNSVLTQPQVLQTVQKSVPAVKSIPTTHQVLQTVHNTVPINTLPKSSDAVTSVRPVVSKVRATALNDHFNPVSESITAKPANTRQNSVIHSKLAVGKVKHIPATLSGLKATRVL